MSGLSGVAGEAVEVVKTAETTMKEAIGEMDGEASASEILTATCQINDATNAASAATAAVQKEDQIQQQAISNLK